MARIFLTALVWVYLSASTTWAETDPGSDKSFHVGRLLIDGRDVCNATLISPSIVLTAAHCLFVDSSQSIVRIEQAQFLVRSQHDGKRRVFDARDFALSPKYKRSDSHEGSLRSLKYDVALIRLNGIATRGPAENLAEPSSNNSITYISHELTKDRSPHGTENCLTKMLEDEDILLLSCTRREGFSGTPVFTRTKGKRTIVGVVTARSTRSNVPVLYASIPQRMFDTLVWKRDVGSYYLDVLMP